MTKEEVIQILRDHYKAVVYIAYDPDGETNYIRVSLNAFKYEFFFGFKDGVSIQEVMAFINQEDKEIRDLIWR